MSLLASPDIPLAKGMIDCLDVREIGGCTTILVGKNATADGSVIIGHNEDMGNLSGRLIFQPRQTYSEKEIDLNYVTVPQVLKTNQYWATGNSQPVADKHFDGGWILCGMNEYGVSMCCNSMDTREERIPKGKGILRYSIRQLLLERSKTARDAVNLVGQLIDTYGQSDIPIAYCISDRNEAWLVETTNRHWIARRIPDNSFHIEANQYTIETDWDLASDDLIDYAVAQGWYNPASGPFNFKYVYINQNNIDHPSDTSREYQGSYMLSDRVGSITVKDILSVLSQPPIQVTGTQSFMVYHFRGDIPPEIGCLMWYGMCSANSNIAIPVYLGSSRVPEEYKKASYTYDSMSAWWQFESLQKLVYPRQWEYAEKYHVIRKELDRLQDEIFIESFAVKNKALTLWERWEVKEAKELLTNHTYEKLNNTLKMVMETLLYIR